MEKVIKWFIISALLLIVLYPLLREAQTKSSYIEIYLDDVKNIGEDSFSFTINNNIDEDKYINYVIIKESLGKSEIVDSNQIYIAKGSKYEVSQKINIGDSAAKYRVIIPSTNQEISFWVKPEIVYMSKAVPFPVIPDIPWEMQDPLVRQYYRYS